MTTFHAVDMDVDGNFVAGGRSEDTSLTTAPSPIVVYTSQYNYYKWAKQIQGTYDHVKVVKLNPDGDRAVISMDTAPLLLIIVNTADGTIINAYKDNVA